MLGQLSPSESVRVRRATQAELKTPLMPGRQADGAGSAVPDPRAERPDAARAGDPARLAGPPISEQIETARRERRVLARVCRAAWRLEQAGRERAWALASALRRGSAIRTLAGAWLVRTARFAP